MDIIQTVAEMQHVTYKQQHHTIGFVPTMGYLHEGHTALIDRARQESDIVIVSIFVNPLQFGPNEDFDRYPRDEQRDIEIAQQHGVDYLFMPTVEEMYNDEPTVQVTVKNRTNVLCGKSRPGHFDGVATVLVKLFHISNATYAYFGLKDAQQVAVVDGLINDFHFTTKIVGVPTVREKDGLAKSSRNVYLSANERQEATQLYTALTNAQQDMIDGEKNPVIIREKIKRYIEMYTSAKIDYVEILTYPALQPIETIDRTVIIAVAVYFSQARLIDNLIVSEKGFIPEQLF
ncbi:pantoate--beta-alanine ligase [Gracilibacillus halophilus YIM-C55.5]|uniref:Pantothenate synthetase n=1 Tax=Gracilibacillus halophilus YIM-C55.5 TaxID=1308866 RepID=N4WAI2_9BACI|nr:pantoate--beta-alanine ligase [Gracilibacillus halophilus]ENH97318.1 pantoate--beta-alanine ligase [Gracilibacillus halophilus YIM-C55.5]